MTADESSELMKHLPDGSASFELVALLLVATAVVLMRVRSTIQGVREHVR